MPFGQYLHEMSIAETYGDELTLRAKADIFNIELPIVPSLGWHAREIISPASSVPVWRGTLGHFAEGHGERYVVLKQSKEHISPISLGNLTGEISVLEKMAYESISRKRTRFRVE